MADTKFNGLVPHLTDLLGKHHELYSGRCKGEYWEEICAKALVSAGFGSNWKPDFNHKVGEDQATSCGIRISNKSGKLCTNKQTVEISGSRLTSYPTLQEKLDFLQNKTEDYIFCLATNDKDWKVNNKVYYFIVIDSSDLNYASAAWQDTLGTKKSSLGKVVGHHCVGTGYTAKIVNSMSHQLWTVVEHSLYKEIHELII